MKMCGSRILLLISLAVSAASPALAEGATPVAITVDDLPLHGPVPPGVTRLDLVKTFISVFQKHGLTGVYGFVNAQKVAAEPDLIQVLDAWMAAGFKVGNHTYSHMNLETSTADAWEADVVKNEALVAQVAGDSDYHWFRFPFLAEGETQAKRDQIRLFLAARGYQLASVTLDWLDSNWNEPYARCAAKSDQSSIDWLKQTYLDGAKAQLVRSAGMAQTLFGRQVAQTVLIHLGALDAVMLDDVLTAFEAGGARFVTLEEAHQDPMYALDPTQDVRGRRNFLDQLTVHAGKQPPQGPQKLPQFDTICK
jgi:peptidoglycan/xylan/chitin deacetylase (PgdA/CDA1 family)